jgi:hypothetical protein
MIALSIWAMIYPMIWRVMGDNDLMKNDNFACFPVLFRLFSSICSIGIQGKHRTGKRSRLLGVCGMICMCLCLVCLS